jgi:hypothetical protein
LSNPTSFGVLIRALSSGSLPGNAAKAAPGTTSATAKKTTASGVRKR